MYSHEQSTRGVFLQAHEQKWQQNQVLTGYISCWGKGPGLPIAVPRTAIEGEFNFGKATYPAQGNFQKGTSLWAFGGQHT